MSCLAIVLARMLSEHLLMLGQVVPECPRFFGTVAILSVEAVHTSQTPFVVTVVETRQVSGQSTVAALGAFHCGIASGTRLRVTWPLALTVPQPGDLWRIQARVRPPAGFANPGGFDYERWLFSERIRGTGHAQSAQLVQSAASGASTRFRESIRGELLSGRYVHGAVLLALAVADTSGMTAEAWEPFRNTGTIHLLVVSGLHIAVVAMLAAVPGLVVGRLFACVCPGVPAAWWGALAGLAGAMAYTALTGMEVPALRAVLMLAGVVLFLFLARGLGTWGSFGLVLLLVTAVAPLSILSQGYWLSFGAVAVLLLAFAQRYRSAQLVSRVRLLVVSQLVLGVAMLPWLGATVGQFAVASLWINVLVVPLVSALAIPLVLIGCAVLPVSEVLAAGCFRLSDMAMALVMGVLDLAAATPVMLLPDHGLVVWVLVLIAAMSLLLPLPTRYRVLLIPLWALALVPAWPRLPAGEFRLHVLDVGQGSAALVETRHHTWVFDTGPHYPLSIDTGAAVVAPALASLPVPAPEGIIVTHPDLDHAGGEKALLARFGGVIRWGSEGSKQVRNCHLPTAFVRDGVRFQFLSSAAARFAPVANDRSCTLLVDNGDHAVLLTGDSSSWVEMSLLRQLKPSVRHRLRVVLVPHHGSRSSSSRAWVNVLRPDFALVSAGRFNRYGHPHPLIVERYQSHGAQVLITGHEGRLLWSSIIPDQVARYRDTHRRYWRAVPSETVRSRSR